MHACRHVAAGQKVRAARANVVQMPADKPGDKRPPAGQSTCADAAASRYVICHIPWVALAPYQGMARRSGLLLHESHRSLLDGLA